MRKGMETDPGKSGPYQPMLADTYAYPASRRERSRNARRRWRQAGTCHLRSAGGGDLRQNRQNRGGAPTVTEAKKTWRPRVRTRSNRGRPRAPRRKGRRIRVARKGRPRSRRISHKSQDEPDVETPPRRSALPRAGEAHRDSGLRRQFRVESSEPEAARGSRTDAVSRRSFVAKRRELGEARLICPRDIR